MLRLSLTAAIVVAALYIALCAALYFGQFRLIYVPSRGGIYTPTESGIAFEDVSLATEDGESLHAWFVPAAVDNARGVTVLFAHGNGGNITDRNETVVQLHRLGVDTLMFDYRGYGRSTGSPTEAGTYADIDAAYRWLRVARGVAARDIVVFGRSLGGGPASWLAETREVGGLILESTFTSVPDVAARRYPFVPVHRLSRVRYPTLERLARIDVPVLVAHGPEDATVPYAHGRELHAAARRALPFLELEGPHATGFLDTGERYEKGLVSLFDAVKDRRR